MNLYPVLRKWNYLKGKKTPKRLKRLRHKIHEYKTQSVIFDPSGNSKFSAIGGVPNDKDKFDWPELEGKRLQFVMAIDLFEVANIYEFDWLPKTGQLLFFYDVEEQPWGFDPKDKPSHRVVYLKNPTDINPGENNTFNHCSMVPSKNWSFPSPERLEDKFKVLSEEEVDAYVEDCELILPETNFIWNPQMGGFPDVIQCDEMEEEAQLASNGIYCGDNSLRSNPNLDELKKGSSDWKLLLQLPSDEFYGYMWGNVGTIFFWVKSTDALEGNFDNTWLILQCS